MWRTILAHVYVIVMATIVVMAGNTLADRYGDEIVSFVSGVSSQASVEKTKFEQNAKDWNRQILD